MYGREFIHRIDDVFLKWLLQLKNSKGELVRSLNPHADRVQRDVSAYNDRKKLRFAVTLHYSLSDRSVLRILCRIQRMCQAHVFATQPRGGTSRS